MISSKFVAILLSLHFVSGSCPERGAKSYLAE